MGLGRFGECADGRHRQSAYHKFLKKAKLRLERRLAKKNPEHPPAYRRFRGWET